MAEIPDVPWKVRWDQEFEDNISTLKASGSFDRYRKQILRIIKNPVREGKYKSGGYKGLKTVHVSGSDQDIICFELTPGINSQSNIEKLDELYFHHITHWDNYDSALNSRQPADGGYEYIIQIPYFGGQYDPERVLSKVYDFAKSHEGCHVERQDWEDEYLGITGHIDPTETSDLEELLPASATIEFTQIDPF